MKNRALVSLCIPTNGVIEWVIPVIESIYNDKSILLDCFEVIVADNGNNADFPKSIEEYQKRYHNLYYTKTTTPGFLNQIESFRLANGQLVKFVNHRMPLVEGFLGDLIAIAEKYFDTKPQLFFSNGTLKNTPECVVFDDFDAYVNCISYMASWSGGTAFWKDEVDLVRAENYNTFFPHISFVLNKSKSSKYLVINKKGFENIKADETKKGKYNLFYAFGVVFPELILHYVVNGDISLDTFLGIMKRMQRFLGQQYMEYCILKKPCSYDLTNMKSNCDVFFDSHRVKLIAYLKLLKKVLVRR